MPSALESNVHAQPSAPAPVSRQGEKIRRLGDPDMTKYKNRNTATKIFKKLREKKKGSYVGVSSIASSVDIGNALCGRFLSIYRIRTENVKKPKKGKKMVVRKLKRPDYKIIDVILDLINKGMVPDKDWDEEMK
jgi:hypothetical protein